MDTRAFSFCPISLCPEKRNRAPTNSAQRRGSKRKQPGPLRFGMWTPGTAYGCSKDMPRWAGCRDFRAVPEKKPGQAFFPMWEDHHFSGFPQAFPQWSSDVKDLLIKPQISICGKPVPLRCKDGARVPFLEQHGANSPRVFSVWEDQLPCVNMCGLHFFTLSFVYGTRRNDALCDQSRSR